MSLQLTETIDMVKWQNTVVHYIDRSEFIFSVLTEVGLCFTFNALNSYEIYTEEYVLK